MPDPVPNGSLRPTSGFTVALAAVIGAALSWLAFASAEKLDWPLPGLPLVAALAIGLLAAAIGLIAWRTHRSIQVRREPVQPGLAVRLVVLGKTCVLAGAGLAGGYAAIAVYFLPRWSAALPRERVVSSTVAVVASIGLAVAGIILERSCRIPRDPPADATPKGLPGSQSTPN